MRRDSQLSMNRGDNALIRGYLPKDSSCQTHSVKEAVKILSGYGGSVIEFLDLGCGDGNSYSHFSGIKGLNWTGIDIEESPEVNARKRNDLRFLTYDGVDIPLPDNSVDIIYSNQVFEHVRYPEALLRNAYRVLKKNGLLVGSTSHLEPFHSRSLWNFTPYGFACLLQSAGFKDILLKPGIDGMTLNLRHILGRARIRLLSDVFYKRESPLNFAIEAFTRLMGIGVERRSAIKLGVSGQFIFISGK